MKRIIRRNRTMAFAVLIVTGILLLGGCGNFFTAEVQEFVVDGESDAGINGASVYFYRDEPSSAGAEGFFTKTSTVTANGNPGYYSSRVVWNSFFADFGPEGDSGEIYVGVVHPDFSSRVVLMEGIFSDTTNNLGDIVLSRTSFEIQVRGTVEDTGSDPLRVYPGIKVQLRYVAPGAPEETSTTFSGVNGAFEFDISWTDTGVQESSINITEVWYDMNANNAEDDAPFPEVVTFTERTASSADTVHILPPYDPIP
jgi:hypothetical protein